MATFVIGEDLLKKLCGAVGIQYDQCSRLILDVARDRVVTVHTTTYADEAIVDLDWKIGLTKVEPK